MQCSRSSTVHVLCMFGPECMQNLTHGALFPQWVGSPCGLHGPYIFYKAFRFRIESRTRILSLGDFFLVRCKPDEPLCIAELQLLWEERTTKQLLSSSKLYFLPEDTPQGRNVSHGEVITPLLKWTRRRVCALSLFFPPIMFPV